MKSRKTGRARQLIESILLVHGADDADMLVSLDGERIRARHVIQRLRATIDSVEETLADESYPPGPDVIQAVVLTAVDLGTTLARLGAFSASLGSKP